MDINLDSQDIVKKREEYIDMLRAFSVAKKEQWKRVPYLALQADGRDGHNDARHVAFSRGYWTIYSSESHGYYTVYVDCNSGELVHSFSIDESELKPAPWKRLLLLDPAEIDADKVVSELEKIAQKPCASYYNASEKDQWREEMRKRYDVQPVFERKRKVTNQS